MKKLLLTLCLLVAMAGIATADVIWDQSDYDVNWAGYWNSETGCAPFGGTIHVANDITIFDYVTVNSITTYYTKFDFGFMGVNEAYLWIAPRTGALPVTGTDNPHDPGLLVPVAVTDVGGAFAVTASGLNVVLTPGDYWFSLTPIAPSGPWGPEFNIVSNTTIGMDSVAIEFCGFFPPAWVEGQPGLDASILIEGTVDVVANEDVSWGQVKALYR